MSTGQKTRDEIMDLVDLLNVESAMDTGKVSRDQGTNTDNGPDDASDQRKQPGIWTCDKDGVVVWATVSAMYVPPNTGALVGVVDKRDADDVEVVDKRDADDGVDDASGSSCVDFKVPRMISVTNPEQQPEPKRLKAAP
jgi:hypothetical protein